MNHILSPLARRYNLFDELWIDKSKGPSLRVSIDALDFAIIHRIEYVINFVIDFYKQKDDLNQKTPCRGLTPLHVAAITGNVEAAAQLIAAGAKTDCCDHQNWTPLHHAALAGNSVMIDLLTRSGTNLQVQTTLGATFKNISDLLHPPQSNPKVVWKEADGPVRLITCDEFYNYTSSKFLSENKITQEQLFSYWNTPPKDLQDELAFASEFKQKYLAQEEMPVHVLSKVICNSEGTPLISSPGIGLFANKPLAPKELIGEYLGVIEEREVLNNFVLKKSINAKEHRNEIPHINDGFINCVLVPIHGVKGLPTRYIFVATEPIAKGDQFCWNYGFHSVKFGPYVELRRKEVREFIKTHDVQYLVRCLTLTGTSGALSFEDFVNAEKFRYILSTPSTFFLMALEGVLNPLQVRELHKLSYSMHCLPADRFFEFRSIPDVVLTAKELIDRLKKCFPQVSTAYFHFLMELPAIKGIEFTLDFASQANAFFHTKLEHLAKDMDLNEIWEAGDKTLLGVLQKNFFEGALNK